MQVNIKIMAIAMCLGCVLGSETTAQSGAASTEPQNAQEPESTANKSTETAEQKDRPQAGINARFLDPEMKVQEWIDRFEGESREIFAAREAVCEAVRLEKGMRLADVGAGTGFFARLFATRVGNEGRVYAVDVSPAFIRHIGDINKKQSIENITALQCGEDSVNLPAESIDVAFVCDTYHHFEYPKSTTASIFQALRPGGHLVLIDFNREVGQSREWILGHVRAGKNTFRREIEDAGFVFEDEVSIEGFRENYLLRFRKPSK